MSEKLIVNRKIRYIGGKILKQILMTLIATLVFIIYGSIINDRDSVEVIARINDKLYLYVLFTSAWLLIAYSVDAAIIYFNNHVSYGATRKEALCDIILIELVYMFVSFCIICIIRMFNNGQIISPQLSMAILLMTFGVGLLLGVIVMTLGRKGYYIFVAFAVMLGGLIVLGAKSKDELMSIGIQMHTGVCVIVSILFAVLSIAIYAAVTRKISVRI